MWARILPSLAVVAACSGGDGRVGSSPDAAGRTSARLQVVLSLPHDAEPELQVAARFLRFRDLDVESAHVLAGATGVPAVLVPEGRCMALGVDQLLDAALAETTPDSGVQLLDAGEIVIRVAGRAIRLEPRYLPEVTPLVSGVQYQAEPPPSGVDLPLEPGVGDTFVSAFGGDEIGRFDVAVPVPAAARLESIAGMDPASGPLLDRDADLMVTLAAPAAGGDESTSVVLSWDAAGGGELRCRVMAGARRVRIGRAVLAAVPAGADLDVAVERTVRTPLAAPGLDSGDIAVGVRDVVRARAL